ncbi:MAG: nucleotidyltransferase family protein [Oscillospiraceae bacterium]|nr:nucleotidyltransferase family protein [Oscillospiraceae bacterium]
MKAVILSGGEGTRLRAISGGLPKPMMPLLGTPLLEHTVALLRENGFDRLCLTLHYQPQMIREHFRDGSAFGVSIEYREEGAPLGTAGAVLNCRDFIGEENVLVISGDSACDFDLAALAAEHRRGVTIALAAQSDPLPYGLVITDRAGNVTGFLEKPAWERVVTDQVSTGIYVLSPDVLRHIPAGQPYDFAKELFPRLLELGVPMRGQVMEGYWCDIGTPRAYYQCNLDTLNGLYHLPGAEEAPRRIIPCRNRARLMRAVGEAMAEFGSDFSDGLTVTFPSGRAHLAPMADQSALFLEGERAAVRKLEASARKLNESL